MVFQHGELHVRLQREAPSTGIAVHQTLHKGECSILPQRALAVGLWSLQSLTGSHEAHMGLRWGQE